LRGESSLSAFHEELLLKEELGKKECLGKSVLLQMICLHGSFSLLPRSHK